MPPFVIFRTDKTEDTPQQRFIGQVGSDDLSKVSEVTKTVTGERVNHISGSPFGKSGHTESFMVDFIDKDTLGGELPAGTYGPPE